MTHTLNHWMQLTAQFLLGYSAPQKSWPLIGIGIRMAQDVGAHRRKSNRGNMTVEDEMLKRAVWYVLFLRWVVCIS